MLRFAVSAARSTNIYTKLSKACSRSSVSWYCTGAKPVDPIPSKVMDLSGDETTPNVKEALDKVLNLTFGEMIQFHKALGKKLGMSPGMMQMPAMGAAPVGAGAGQAAAPEAAPAAAAPPKPAEAAKPARADVKLVGYPDAAKFKVLKEIRVLKPGMNLMDSKALIEGFPKVIAEGLPTVDAENWKTKLTEAGAQIELV